MLCKHIFIFAQAINSPSKDYLGCTNLLSCTHFVRTSCVVQKRHHFDCILAQDIMEQPKKLSSDSIFIYCAHNFYVVTLVTQMIIMHII